jgi:hypothetical protein
MDQLREVNPNAPLKVDGLSLQDHGGGTNSEGQPFGTTTVDALAHALAIYETRPNHIVAFANLDSEVQALLPMSHAKTKKAPGPVHTDLFATGHS